MNIKLTDHNFPEDLKMMSERELGLLSYEIRDFLIEVVSKTGGHIASNLGVVELTIALHKVYNSPEDKIIWDVGHQSYTHKILTGRANQFHTLRQISGLSGFPKRQESPHDIFDSGHSSNSISVALGIAAARDIKGDKEIVIAVIGDGALSGGVAYEALNNAGHSKENMTVILNDNEMSIGKNSGGMSSHLGKLRMSKEYNRFKKQLKKTITGIPRLGEGLYSGLEHLRDAIKYAVVPGVIFEELGFKYLGPVDGHNIHDLIEIFEIAKSVEGPILIHIVTKKGKGYTTAEKSPSKFHGVGPFDPATGEMNDHSSSVAYSTVFGNKLVELAKEDKRIVAISAAMIEGTGLGKFSELFPSRTFDVAIAEQHAVSFAAGLALNGLKPIVAIYSTFLQRAYDEILLDVCMQNLPVIFAIDRAGIVGADGETHHGIFDLSYLSSMPNMTVMAPKDAKELSSMLDYALKLGTPCAIRYPRGEVAAFHKSKQDFPINGSAEVYQSGTDATIVAVGKMMVNASKALKILSLKGLSVELINARFVKPIDLATIITSAQKTKLVITIEDNTLAGGFGSIVMMALAESEMTDIKVHALGWPDKFIQHGRVSELEQIYKLDPESLADKVCEIIEGKN